MKKAKKKEVKKSSREPKKLSATPPLANYVRYTDKSSFKLTVELLESLWTQAYEAGLLDMGRFPSITILIPSKSKKDCLFKVNALLSIERRSNISEKEKTKNE